MQYVYLVVQSDMQSECRHRLHGPDVAAQELLQELGQFRAACERYFGAILWLGASCQPTTDPGQGCTLHFMYALLIGPWWAMPCMPFSHRSGAPCLPCRWNSEEGPSLQIARVVHRRPGLSRPSPGAMHCVFNERARGGQTKAR